MKPVESITLSERAYQPERAAHRHDHAQALFPQRGRLQLSWNAERGAVHGGQAALVPPDTEHAFWSDGDSRCLVIDIPRSVHEELAFGHADAAGFRPMDDRLRVVATSLACEARQDISDPLATEALGLYAASVLIRGARTSLRSSSAGAPRIVSRAAAFLETHGMEPVTIAEIAQAAGVSSVHLQRCFRAELGCSVVEYVHRLRIDRARSLLGETDLTMLEITQRVGFASQSHLSRLFSREIGVSPSRYRSMTRSGKDTIGSSKTR